MKSKQGRRKNMSLSEVPSEIIDIVISFLPGVDLARCESVCKLWQSLAVSEDKWEHLFRRSFSLYRGDIYNNSYKIAYVDRFLRTSRKVNKLVIIGEDKNVYIIDPHDQTHQVQLTNDASETILYIQPCWSPHAEYIAISRIEEVFSPHQAIHKCSLIVKSIDLHGNSAKDVLQIANQNAPFYFYWSPDGTMLSYLSNHHTGVALRVVDVAKTLLNNLNQQPNPHKDTPYTYYDLYTLLHATNNPTSSASSSSSMASTNSSPTPKVVIDEALPVLHAGRPNFYAWCPNEYKIVSHINSDRLYTLDFEKKSADDNTKSTIDDDNNNNSSSITRKNTELQQQQQYHTAITTDVKEVAETLIFTGTAPFTAPHITRDNKIIFARSVLSKPASTQHEDQEEEEEDYSDQDSNADQDEEDIATLHPRRHRPAKRELVIADLSKVSAQQIEEVILEFSGAISFVVSNDESLIAMYSHDGTHHRLHVYNRRTRRTGFVSDQIVTAFFISPDSRTLVFMALEHQHSNHVIMRYWVRNDVAAALPGSASSSALSSAAEAAAVAGTTTTSLSWALLSSSRILVEYLRFFDQYAKSLTFFSPDSRYLCLSVKGVPQRRSGSTSGSFLSDVLRQLYNHRAQDEVVIFPVDDHHQQQQENHRIIAAGTFSAWSPL